MPSFPPHGLAPIASHKPIPRRHPVPHTQTNIAGPVPPQTDRPRNPRTRRPRKALATGKIPFLPPPATARASTSSPSAPPLASAPAHACTHTPLSTRASAFPSEESATLPASPWFPRSTLQTDSVAAVGCPPPKTNDHPRASGRHIDEPI